MTSTRPSRRLASRPVGPRIAAIVVALALVDAPLATAFAGPALPDVDETPPASAEPNPVVEEAEALYREGLADYETFEYEGAIKKWTQAYGKLGATEGTGAMRNAIVYNIARAREKAYEQDKDIEHLKKAKALLERYIADEKAAGTSDEADIAKAQARVDEIGARIAEIERAAERQTTARKSSTDGADRGEGRRPGTGLLAGGGVMIALGTGLLVGGVTAGALIGRSADRRIPELDQLGEEDERVAELERGRRGNIVMIACGAAGGAVAVAGVALVVVGAMKRRKASGTTAVVPAIGPGIAGIALHGRF